MTLTSLIRHPFGILAVIAAAILFTVPFFPSAESARRPVAQKSPATPAAEPQGAEAMLNAALEDIGKGRFDAALGRIETLIKAHPNFRLAYLIKGDLLLARARPLSELGSAPKAPADRLDDLRAEALVRLRAYRDPPTKDMLPRYLLEMPLEHQHAVVVDTARSRLYLYGNNKGRPQLVADYYISVGRNGPRKMREGDLKTPIGVYHVTSSLPAKKLPDLYGSGAFPINYPNDLDRRMGRNGHGIWLHGTPSDTFSRPPRASDGCVVLSNTDLNVVAKHLQVGMTPVIISEGVQWISTDDWSAERRNFLDQLEQWRADWESRDTARYLQNYSRKFASGGQNYDSFARQKQQVNVGKEWIKLKIANVSAFRNPGREDMMVVTFEQDYRSNNLNNVMKKRQYWAREGNRWRIIYEGAA